MTFDLRGTQALVVGGCLLLSSTAKIRVPNGARTKTLPILLASSMSGRVRARGLSAFERQVLWLGLCAFEAGLAAWLLTGWRPVAGLGVTAGFMAVCVGAVGWGLVAARGAACGCFGTRTPNSPWVAVRSGWLALGCGMSAFVCPPPVRGHDVAGLLLISNAIVLVWSSSSARLLLTAGVRRTAQSAVDILTREPDPHGLFDALGALGFWETLGDDVEVGPARRVWRQVGWLLVEYPGRLRGREVLFVAGSCLRCSMSAVRVAIVAVRGDQVELLSSWDSSRTTRGGGSRPTSLRETQAASSTSAA